MNEDKKALTIDHQYPNIIEHVCLYEQCDKKIRTICHGCFANHQHQKKQLNKYIVNLKEFENIVYQKQSKIDQSHENFSIIQQQIEEFISQIKENIKRLTSQMEQIQYDFGKQKEFYSYLIQKIQFNYEIVQSEDIINFLKIDQTIQYSKELAQQRIYFTQIIEECKQANLIIEEANKFVNNNQFNINKNHPNEINFKTQYEINVAQISHNEELLIYGGEDQYFTIVDLKSNKELHKICLNSFITTCKFSPNDQFIYIGEISGNISVYHRDKGLRLIFSKKVHTQTVNNLSVNQNLIISCSNDLSIFITDFKTKQCILQIQNAHQNSIYGLDYDQQNNIIVTSSKDLSIKFFDSQNGLLKFTKKLAHDNFIMQIQLIKQNQKLISASYDELKIWGINLEQRQIIFQNSIIQNSIYNFTSVKKDSLIIVITENFLNVYDESLGLVYNFYHNKKENQFLGNYLQNYSVLLNSTIGEHELYYHQGKMQFCFYLYLEHLQLLNIENSSP